MLKRLTYTERNEVRKALTDDLCDIVIGDSEDGTFFAEVYGTFVEGESIPAVLRELAAIAEEN